MLGSSVLSEISITAPFDRRKPQLYIEEFIAFSLINKNIRSGFVQTADFWKSLENSLTQGEASCIFLLSNVRQMLNDIIERAECV